MKNISNDACIGEPDDRINTTFQLGLSDNEVKERVEKGRQNTAIDTCEKTTKQILKENVFTYFNLIFFVLTVLLILAESYRSLRFYQSL